MYPDNLLYTKEHEWIRIEDDNGIVGITDYAQEQLGDIVYVEAPEVGLAVSEGDTIGSIESVKTVSDIFTPVGGEIIEINEALEDNPELVNQSPYDGGWIYKIALAESSELDSLMDATSYQKYLKESES